jgi:hypothetical protein
MKQQFVITHRYAVLWGTEETLKTLSRPTFKHAVFLRKEKEKQLFGPNILTEGVFVTQLSSNARESHFDELRGVTTNCRSMTDVSSRHK